MTAVPTGSLSKSSNNRNSRFRRFAKLIDLLSTVHTIYLVLQYRWNFTIALLFSLPIYPAVRRLLTENNTKLSNFILNWGIPSFALAVGYLSLMNLLASDFNPFIYFQF